MPQFSPLKRCLSLLLVCGVLCGLLVVPPAQAASHSPTAGEAFYGQLSSANQEAYDAIQAQVEKLAENSTDPSAVSYTPTQGNPDGAAIFAFFRDHPEYFWIDSSKLVWSESNGQWSLSSKITGESFFYEGFDTGTLSSVRAEFEAKVQEIITGMPGGDRVAQLRYLNTGLLSTMSITPWVWAPPTTPGVPPAAF